MGSAVQSNGEYVNQVKKGVQAGWDRQRKVPRMMAAKRAYMDRSLDGAFFIQLQPVSVA